MKAFYQCQKCVPLQPQIFYGREMKYIRWLDKVWQDKLTPVRLIKLSVAELLKAPDIFLSIKVNRDSGFCSPWRVLALSFFTDTEVGHDRRMSNTTGRHPVTLRVGTHLIFPLSTQAVDLYISCNLDSQSCLDFESMCLLVREKVWDWQEVLLRGGWGGLWFVCAVL